MKDFTFETLTGENIELTMKNIQSTIFNYYINGELQATGTRREIAEQLDTKMQYINSLVYRTKKYNKRIKHVLKVVEVK